MCLHQRITLLKDSWRELINSKVVGCSCEIIVGQTIDILKVCLVPAFVETHSLMI